MPRNGSGTYTLPEPAFTPGSVISSTAMNSDLSDIALALTNSMAADGQTPFTGSLRVSNGSALLPSYSFITDSTDGIYHPASGQIAVAVGGVATLNIQTPSSTAGGGLIGLNSTILVPIGMVVDFAGATAPTGWFLCYGQAISRSTYVELFTVLSTTWGSGDGSSTFNLPDLRGRAGIGKDNMGGSAASRITVGGCGIDGATLGAAGGAQTHTLVTGEMPSHTHTASVTDPTHTHTSNAITSGGNSLDSGPFGAPAANAATINAASTGISVSNASTGGGGAHNNVQPIAMVNKIIFAGHP